MSNLAIKAENVSKLYRLGNVGTGTLSNDLTRFWAKLRGKEDPFSKIASSNDRSKKADSDYVWSLRDIDFEIKKGDAVGIIGRNGAGKSTLLKVLSRITSPTTGRVRIDGRVASLLEVGTGFSPDLTGRQNIYMNGAILGMSRSEVSAKMDEIVAFSGVEGYIDTPVKRYSSGMYVRLAFAVAAHLEPEILIVDEVLAVGDAEFQKKCLGKMQDVNKSEGRTVLFVSHNMQAVSTLTRSAIYMSNGTLKSYGETEGIMSEYFRDNLSSDHSIRYFQEKSFEKPYVKEVNIHTSKPNNIHEFGKELVIDALLFVDKPMNDLCFSFHIVDKDEKSVVNLWNYRITGGVTERSGFHRVVCKLPNPKLYLGRYSLKVYFSQPPGGQFYEYLEAICHFEVVMHGIYREFPWMEKEANYIEEFSWENEE